MGGETGGGPASEQTVLREVASFPNKRCRMSVKQNSKGLFQLDVTAEYDTPEESAKQLDKAIQVALKVVEERGLKLAG